MRRKMLMIAVFLLILALVAAAVYGGRQVYSDYRDNAAADQIQEDKPAVNQVQEHDFSADHTADHTDDTDEEKTTSSPLMDFSKIQGVNSEIIAWLTIPGTMIDYPVAQTDNNDYYLNHDMRKKANANGTLFLDYRAHADFSDFSSVIYGHHMRSGRMFQNLVKFKDKAFFDEHTAGMLYTPDKTWRLEIFAVTVVRADSELYQYAFPSVSGRGAHLAMIREASMYYREIGVSADDRILLLSTCSYEYRDARTILAARLS